jgi:hypothetical protein
VREKAGDEKVVGSEREVLGVALGHYGILTGNSDRCCYWMVNS